MSKRPTPFSQDTPVSPEAIAALQNIRRTFGFDNEKLVSFISAITPTDEQLISLQEAAKRSTEPIPKLFLNGALVRASRFQKALDKNGRPVTRSAGAAFRIQEALISLTKETTPLSIQKVFRVSGSRWASCFAFFEDNRETVMLAVASQHIASNHSRPNAKEILERLNNAVAIQRGENKGESKIKYTIEECERFLTTNDAKIKNLLKKIVPKVEPTAPQKKSTSNKRPAAIKP